MTELAKILVNLGISDVPLGTARTSQDLKEVLQAAEQWSLDALTDEQVAAMRADLEAREPIEVLGGGKARVDVDATLATGWVTWAVIRPTSEGDS